MPSQAEGVATSDLAEMREMQVAVGSDTSRDASADSAIPGIALRDLNADAARVGWSPTLAALARFIRPWRAQLAVVTGCGVARVAAFIGVGVIGALAIAG